MRAEPPMTAEGQKRRAAETEHRRTHAFEDPEVFPLGERCVNFGIPRLQAGYNSYIQIIQSPGYVTIPVRIGTLTSKISMPFRVCSPRKRYV